MTPKTLDSFGYKLFPPRYPADMLQWIRRCNTPYVANVHTFGEQVRQASQAAAKEVEKSNTANGFASSLKTPMTPIARQKQADREFFTNLLSSAATKRDAKAYITRLKNPSKVKTTPAVTPPLRSRVNVGGLFGRARAVDQSPVFSQYAIEQEGFEEKETLHVALVKLRDLDKVADNVVVGIAETLIQLARLSMSPCIVLESTQHDSEERRQILKSQAGRLSAAIDAMSKTSRIVEHVFTVTESGEIILSMKDLLRMPLRRGLIPLVLPTAYSEQTSKLVALSADEAMLTLTKEFAEIGKQRKYNSAQSQGKQVSLDRIIVIDQAGGIPKSQASDGKHVFLNLEQEYAAISKHLERMGADESGRHLENLNMLRQALMLLPPSASGLLATPEEVANVVMLERDSNPSSVGTRRQKNTLVHNLLTDKPAYSSSLPKSRLSTRASPITAPPVSTFVKHGMPLTMLPDPTEQPWTPTVSRIKLSDPQINLERLVCLIDDSFNRSLDTESYLKRVNDRMAGVIIAGDYEGGAILTWETPPGVDENDTDRLVPYLDKFAVLKRSQGAGGVADILFNAMVRTCFPDGVCWRSRKNNPVNKWYFERSTGTRKIPDMNWTMFWTTPGVAEDSQKFLDYEGVCRGVEPTWLDKKIAAD